MGHVSEGLQQRLTYQRKASSRPGSSSRPSSRPVSSLRSSSLRETLFLCANNRSRLSSAGERSTADTRPQSRIGMSGDSNARTRSRPSTAHVRRVCSDLRPQTGEHMPKRPMSASGLYSAPLKSDDGAPENRNWQASRHSSYRSHVQEEQTVHEERRQRKRPMTSTGRRTGVLSDRFEHDLRKRGEQREASATTQNWNYISSRHSDQEASSNESSPRSVQTWASLSMKHTRKRRICCDTVASWNMRDIVGARLNKNGCFFPQVYYKRNRPEDTHVTPRIVPVAQSVALEERDTECQKAVERRAGKA